MKKQFLASSYELIDYCESLPDSIFFKKGDKWNAAEVIDHLHRSIAPIHLALSLPSFVLKLFFGRSNRASRNYDTVIKKYKKALEKGGKASNPYIPKGSLSGRKKNSAKLRKLCESVADKIDRRAATDWDSCILPHPLLGKMTLIEMIYFTEFHIVHHLETLKEFNNTL